VRSEKKARIDEREQLADLPSDAYGYLKDINPNGWM
jgi:hypothetical protein